MTSHANLKASASGVALIIGACFTARTAAAHGFGQRYDLPLPFTHFLAGAAVAVLVSFVIAALFMRSTSGGPGKHIEIPLPNWTPTAGQVVAALSTLLFILALLAGFFGDQNSYRNIAPTLVWIVGWVGLMMVSALVIDVWTWLNPWRTLFDLADLTHRRLTGGRWLARNLPYPVSLGAWPAFIFLLALGWVELVDPEAGAPAHIACLAMGYSIVTLAGMTLFGRDAWLRQGEIFTVTFGLVARFAPLAVRSDDAAVSSRLVVRPFGSGLAEAGPASPAMTAIILLLLSTVLYDGFLATPEWTALETRLGGSDAMSLRSLGLAAFWLIVAGAYLVICALMASLSPSSRALNMACQFAFTLVPIAIGYHVAHYLSYLLIQGQYIIPLLSDPFGRGWNLFGTSGYRVDIAFVGARFAWYAAVGAVVLGHIAAVYLAHRRALQLAGDRPAAVRSQVPLTALMIVYTMVSLTILAEPIVARRLDVAPLGPSATIAIPEDAVLPQLGTGTLVPVGADKVARAKLSFQMLGSAFHDGTKMTIADLAYAYSFVYRWSAEADGRHSHSDAAIAATSAGLRAHLAGLRFLPVDTTSKTLRVGDISFVRDLFTIEVYARIAPEDPERDALVAPPWTTLPWHLIALLEEVVEPGWAAFSQAEAERRGIPWLDLVRDGAIKERLETLVAQFEREGYRPAALQSMVSAEEARRRWAALAAFHKAHGHFLVANGPYRLKSWSRDGAVLEAFRDLTYPLGVGSFDAYAIPRQGFVTRWDWNDGRLTISADVETLNKFQRDYRLVRVPLASLPPEMRRRMAPECRLVITDESGRVVLADTAPLAEDASFRIELGDRLPAGRYVAMTAIALAGNVMNADIQHIAIEVAPRP